MRECLNYFGDVQVFRICFHCDSGLNFSVHQHVWQYRDSALAWRRPKPSVLFSDRKDETGLVGTRVTQGRLSEEHDQGGILRCVLTQRSIKLLNAVVRNPWSEVGDGE